jgi:acetyl-CoA carboxylase carboxyltransferase component
MFENEFLPVKFKENMSHFADSTATDSKPEFDQDFVKFFSQLGYSVYEFKPNNPRESSDGLKAYKFSNGQQTFFCCLTDPKIKAGTFSNLSLDYFHRFLDHISLQPSTVPFVFGLNSAGVRLTQTRDMFNRIWGVVPRLFQLRKQRLFLSLSDQQCLGAAALFFAQAHFRICSGKKTIINLTGPAVIDYFFGEDRNFFQYSSAQYQFERHLLIHEYTTNLNDGLGRLNQILCYHFNLPLTDFSEILASNKTKHRRQYFYSSADKHNDFLNAVADQTFEVFPGFSESGLSYLCRKGSFNYGLLINPLAHASNSISVNTIEKYIEALTLFKAMKLPLFVVTDSPGGDPRENNSNRNVIIKSLSLIEALVDYPFAKIGLVAGRCFGGSGLFALPHVHQSNGLYALVGSKFGAISDEFIERLAKNSPEWTLTKSIHKSDLSDLSSTNNIKKIISWSEIPEIIQELQKISEQSTKSH